jgi:ribA/ribD-fused uncharacterized protein
METTINYDLRIFNSDECCVFNKTKEIYGGLSNMAGGYPLVVNDNEIRTSEALFQMCRFPHLPEIQRLILLKKSPLVSKWVSRSYIRDTRPDWDEVNVEVMRWCLRVKLVQNRTKFGDILESTDSKIIIEDSRRNEFWGAIREKENRSLLKGSNILGQLLMELRQFYLANKNEPNCFIVESLKIPDFKLFGQEIGTLKR